jgi:hypothetical protein
MECVYQEIEQYLCTFVSFCQNDWVEWLLLAEFSYNNWVHSSTHKMPFEVGNCTHPRMSVEPWRKVRFEAANRFANRIANAIQETHSALNQAATDMAHFYVHDHWEAEEFGVGDKVWLDGQHIKTKNPSRSLTIGGLAHLRFRRSSHKMHIASSCHRAYAMFTWSSIYPCCADGIQIPLQSVPSLPTWSPCLLIMENPSMRWSVSLTAVRITRSSNFGGRVMGQSTFPGNLLIILPKPRASQ